MKANIARKESAEDTPAPLRRGGLLLGELKFLTIWFWTSKTCLKLLKRYACAVEERRLATWGTEVPDDLVLDQQNLSEALKKEDEKRREERGMNGRGNIM